MLVILSEALVHENAQGSDLPKKWHHLPCSWLLPSSAGMICSCWSPPATPPEPTCLALGQHQVALCPALTQGPALLGAYRSSQSVAVVGGHWLSCLLPPVLPVLCPALAASGVLHQWYEEQCDS